MAGKRNYSQNSGASGAYLQNASIKRFTPQRGQVPGRIPNVRDITRNPKNLASGMGGGMDETTKVFGQNLIGKKLSYKLTTDGTYLNGVIPIIPQIREDVLPTGVTFSGSNFASYAAFARFACEAKLVLGRLQVSTDDTSNFSEAIKVTETYSHGSSMVQNETWDSLAIDLNAQVQGTRIIENTGWIIGDIFHRYEISTMVDSTYFQFTFVITGVGGKVYDVAPPF